MCNRRVNAAKSTDAMNEDRDKNEIGNHEEYKLEDLGIHGAQQSAQNGVDQRQSCSENDDRAIAPAEDGTH